MNDINFLLNDSAKILKMEQSGRSEALKSYYILWVSYQLNKFVLLYVNVDLLVFFSGWSLDSTFFISFVSCIIQWKYESKITGFPYLDFLWCCFMHQYFSFLHYKIKNLMWRQGEFEWSRYVRQTGLGYTSLSSSAYLDVTKVWGCDIPPLTQPPG